ncbi:isoprenylcysteine carboxylmethyltransferase family protein [Streptomyces sp. HNM0575]|uniref:methyltransferase family protein n=1 Tax=Streptomyces sp. HNM0575 TaxID=2716338 RepID=UPI00145D945B|nr:isoprenylcysteine carboxylmethyltransferase family protein [Streptomyces sp. HNM0575]NLU76245.1 isoprenylcysteine carboxylmethyltransferase family protein [Streptomyces sp. HNM0575]
MDSLHAAVVGLTDVCVLIFLVAWIAGAVYFGVKSRNGLSGWTRGLRRTLLIRLALIAAVYAFLRLGGRVPDSFWQHIQYWQPELAVLGALLALASTGLLLWARWSLGTMWASVPMVQDHHELRTDGPYGLVRHPIYTGLLGLITGGMLAGGFGIWILYLAVATPWLLRRVRVEDGMMAGQFGASYEAYRARVPALIPWTRPAPNGPRSAGEGH